MFFVYIIILNMTNLVKYEKKFLLVLLLLVFQAKFFKLAAYIETAHIR